MRAPRNASWLDRTARSRGRRVVALGVAAVVGFTGAAAITAFGRPEVGVAHGFGGDGDGRTRLVVSADGGISDAAFEQLRTTPGVDSAQRVFDGSVLVAGRGITAGTLTARVPGAAVHPDPVGHVTGGTISDPYWSTYGYNLANTGTNSYTKPAVAGDDVDAPTGWAASTGRGQVVAVLDTGYETSHPELAGALWTNPAESCGSTTDTDRDGLVGDCHGWDFYAGDADVNGDTSTDPASGDPNNSHGTGVASLVAGRTGNGLGNAGVAPDATVMPLVIGSGKSVSITAAAQAIHYAADHGATVINGSWGGSGGAQLLQEAIDYAGSKGVLVVVAAGNDGADRGTTPFYPASLHAPNLVVVGASTPSDTRAGFSAYGATTVDLFAPGDLVFTAWPGGGYMLESGTSEASPEVAGAAALYRSVYPADSPAQIKARLLADVTTVPALQGLSVSGGRLSLTALGNTAAGTTYTFTGMTAAPGTVTPSVVVQGPAGAGDYTVQLGLGMSWNGSVYALTDQPITVAGTTRQTGDDGMATFDLGQLPALATQVVVPSTSLQAGRYVLTAQVFLDGAPVGRAYAAPLLVGTAAGPTAAPTASSTAGPTTAAPTATARPTATGTPTSRPSAPATTSRPAASTSAGSTPVAGHPTASARPTPTATAQPTAQPTVSSRPTTTAGAGTSQPAAPTGRPGATGSPGTSTPPAVGTQPVTRSPAAGSTTAGPAPTGTSPTGGAQPGSTGQPGLGGQQTYPGTDAFGLTAISPTRVSTAGGTPVTITGSAIPAGVRVRVGATTAATVAFASATQLTFAAPALPAGSYDVFVFAPDGRSSVLTGGLTYLATGGGPSSAPSSGASSSAPPSSAGPSSGAGSGGPFTGPHGERLMPSALFASLDGRIWGVGCGTACTGLAV